MAKNSFSLFKIKINIKNKILVLSKVANVLRYYVKTWSPVFALKKDSSQDSFLATSEYFFKGVRCFESHERGFLKLKLFQKDK